MNAAFSLELADSATRRLSDAALYELHKRQMAAVDALNYMPRSLTRHHVYHAGQIALLKKG
jgi:hypothetical protein